MKTLNKSEIEKMNFIKSIDKMDRKFMNKIKGGACSTSVSNMDCSCNHTKNDGCANGPGNIYSATANSRIKYTNM